MTISGVNDAPVVTGPLGDQATQQNSAFTYQLPLTTFADIDQGDVLNYTAAMANGSPMPAWLNFDSATQTFSGTPGNADVANLDLIVTATDKGGLSASSVFALNVANVNDAPLVVIPLINQNSQEGTAFSMSIPAGAFTDPDLLYGDKLTLSATLANGSALPNWLVFDPVNLTLGGTAPTGSAGLFGINIVATDTAGAAAINPFQLNVAHAVTTNSCDDNHTSQNQVGNRHDDNQHGSSDHGKCNGGSGDDNLTGSAGADRSCGGRANDTYLINNSGDNVIEKAGGGTDPVQNTIDWTPGANLENRTLLGTNSLNGKGNELSNALEHNGANNWLSGMSGNDAMDGAGGNNLLQGGPGNDILAGASRKNLFDGGAGADKHTGDSGTELFTGGTGNHNVTKLQLVLDAGTYTSSSSDPLFNQQVRDFDFGALAQAFDQALAANPTLTAWNLTDSLLSAHLSGSDTAALGGDLAYQYNLNGSMAGFGLGSAQTVINDASFGVSAQQLHKLADLQIGTARLR